MRTIHSALTRFSAFAAALVWLWGSVLPATEFGATHAVFQKTTKMKKVRVSLMMAALDQASRGDTLADPRLLRCAVAAVGKGGALPVKGNLTLRLEGVSDGGSKVWLGRALTESLDSRGTVVFEDPALAELAGEALDEGAQPERFRIDFKGGKGKKVAEATLDCVHEPTGGAR